MDPLSIAASIVTLAGAIKRITVSYRALYEAFSKAPKELSDLKSELETFTSFLDDVSPSFMLEEERMSRLREHI